MEAPKIVFTIAKATTPPSAPVDCVDHDDYDDNIDEEDKGSRHVRKVQFFLTLLKRPLTFSFETEVSQHWSGQSIPLGNVCLGHV